MINYIISAPFIIYTVYERCDLRCFIGFIKIALGYFL